MHGRRRRIAFEHGLLRREAFGDVPERFEHPSEQQPAFRVIRIQRLRGKLLLVLKKQPDGTWRVARGMWNTSE